MADAQTPTYRFVKPEVGGSDDTWGTKTNADWDRVEALFKSVFTGGTHTPPFAGTLNSAGMPSTLTEPIIINNTLTIKAGAPSIYFEETDQTSPEGDLRFIASNGGLVFQQATGPNETPWDTVETIWTYSRTSNIYTFSDNLDQLLIDCDAKFSNDVFFEANGQTVTLTDASPVTGAGANQLIFRFANANGRMVWSDGPANSNALSYCPGTGQFDTNSGFYKFLTSRVEVVRLDVVNDGNATIYFGSISDHSRSGYIYGDAGKDMVILSGNNTPTGFRLDDDIIHTYGTYFYHKGHYLMLNGSGDELGRLFPGATAVQLRALSTPGGATAAFLSLGFSGVATLDADTVNINSDNPVVVTAPSLTATIFSSSLPQPGNTTQQLNERSRIGGHTADLGANSVGSYGFFHYAGTGLNQGDVVDGDTIRPTTAAGTLDGPDRPASERWMCCGMVPAGSPSDENRSTMFRRVS